MKVRAPDPARAVGGFLQARRKADTPSVREKELIGLEEAADAAWAALPRAGSVDGPFHAAEALGGKPAREILERK
jgi:hypothetical protein